MPISSEGREHIAYLRAVRDHGFDADLRCSIRWALTRIEKLEADVIELKSFRPKRPFVTQVQAEVDPMKDPRFMAKRREPRGYDDF